MRMPVGGRRARGGEDLVEIVERSERRRAEDSELERPSRGFALGAPAAEAR